MIASMYQGERRSHYMISQIINSVTVARDCIWILILNSSGLRDCQLIKLSEITLLHIVLHLLKKRIEFRL